MGEKKEDFEEDVKRLKEWYSKQPHLPQNISDHIFYNFVSGTKSLQRAKEKIDAYFTLRGDTFSLAVDVFPHTETFKNLLKSCYMAVLPEKTPDGYRVLFSAQVNPKKFHIGAFFLRKFIIFELACAMWPEDTSWIAIDDFKGISLEVAKTLDLRLSLGQTKLLEKGLPLKWKGSYFMSAPSVVEYVVKILHPILPTKIRDRVYIWKDTNKMNEILPISMIPAEYGGQGRPIKELGEEWTNLLESKQDWFEEMMKLRSDESKRPKDSFTRETLDFGIEGSFKFLSVD